MTWWPDRAKMSCFETGRGTRREEIGSAGKKIQVAGGTKRAITREGDWKVRLDETAAVEGNPFGSEELVKRKEKAACDSRRRRDATAPSGVGRV